VVIAKDSINQGVIVMEMHYVFCDVGRDCLKSYLHLISSSKS
jgi:hypothetical protein